jgi:hypothetical protein
VLSVLGVLACASRADPRTRRLIEGDSPQSLRGRIASLYKAEIAEDWQALYGLLAPEIRAEVSFDGFAAEARQRNFKIHSFRIGSIRPASSRELPEGVLAAAVVEMAVQLERPDVAPPRETIQTDFWIWQLGDWYLTWRGWSR